MNGGNDLLLNNGGYGENWGHDGGDNGTGDLADGVKDALEKSREVEALLDSEGLSLNNDKDEECAQSDLSEFHLYSIFNIIYFILIFLIY